MSKKKSISSLAFQYVFICLLIFPSALCAQEPKTEGPSARPGPNEKFSVFGTITSEKTGETIIGASITVMHGDAGTSSNEYGFYSLSLTRGAHTIIVSSVGMVRDTIGLTLEKNTRIDIKLKEEDKALEAVVVSSDARGRNLRNSQMSVERINVSETKNIPVLLGERDVLKTLQLLPGVKAAGEGNSGFYVRGGAIDQNLILLDEAPVYNAAHLLGFFSTFNSDAIKNVSLYKGGMPVQYGGRLSSVVDIRMNEGNNQDFGVNGGIGLIASRLNVEGPIQKNKSSFLLSGRRTYADLFLGLSGDTSIKNASLYFYDLNAKANVILNENNRLYLSGYFGRDVLSQNNLTGINWGNATGTLRWNHIYNNRLFSNTSVIFSNYDYKIKINAASTNFQIRSQIRDWNLKHEMQWNKNASNTITAGFNSIYHTITPGEISVTGSTGTVSQGLQNRFALENVLYAGNNWKAGERINLSYGLRLSAFTILGKGDYYIVDTAGSILDTISYASGEVVKTYFNLEPRFSASFLVNEKSSIKLSYTRNSQNLHLISGSTASSPTDKWVASTNLIKPEIADQVALGYYRNIKEGLYELTIETYFKSMRNQVDYRNGAKVFTNEPIETQLLYGIGRAYGMEWLFKKKAGRFNGWISYTLSKTQRKIDGINKNEWYNARQDRTHDIAIVAIFQATKKWNLSANWVYSTGDAVTFPDGKYTLNGVIYYSYSERNAYRMPAYHRLDLGATKQLRKKKRFSSELTFGLYNAYGRANAYQITFRQSETDPDKTEAVKTSLFSFVPSITYNFKF
jgi:hypothetical protein